jgi:proteic killer suppression protein
VIRSFKCKDTETLFVAGSIARFRAIEVAACRKLDYLESAASLSDLRAPPGNRLESLKDDRIGQYSIRINRQYRICFVWRADGAHDVEIVDYHR